MLAGEGVTATVIAVVYVIRWLGGADQSQINSVGTAAWFLLAGAGLLAAGWALWTGRRWGRGVGVFAQLLLLPVAWYLITGSHRPEFGIPLGIVALGTIVLLLSPSAVRWATYQGDWASPESAEPDNR